MSNRQWLLRVVAWVGLWWSCCQKVFLVWLDSNDGVAMSDRQRLLWVLVWAVCFLAGVGVVLAMSPWLGL